jgi:hypothetical protein
LIRSVFSRARADSTWSVLCREPGFAIESFAGKERQAPGAAVTVAADAGRGVRAARRD